MKPSEVPNLYQRLDVASNASIEEIKHAYWAKAKEWHPDMHLQNKKAAQRQFVAIQEAYEVLSDENRRRMYNVALESGLSPNEIMHASWWPVVDGLVVELEKYFDGLLRGLDGLSSEITNLCTEIDASTNAIKDATKRLQDSYARIEEHSGQLRLEAKHLSSQMQQIDSAFGRIEQNLDIEEARANMPPRRSRSNRTNHQTLEGFLFGGLTPKEYYTRRTESNFAA